MRQSDFFKRKSRDEKQKNYIDLNDWELNVCYLLS